MKASSHGLMKAVLVAVLSLFIVSCSGTKEMLVPTGTVPAGVTSAQVRQAVEAACGDYGWQLADGATADEYVAMQLKGKHMAKVRILFTDGTYTIGYLDSSNLKYNEDKGNVSRHYNTWVNNLSQALQNRLNQATFATGAAK